VEETEPTDEVEQPRTPHTPTGEGSHEPHLDKKPLKGILKKEGEENVDRKGLSVAGLESVPGMLFGLVFLKTFLFFCLSLVY